MDPIIVPVLIFAIPIVAITLNSPVAKAIAKSINAKAEASSVSTARVEQLETDVDDLAKRLYELEEDNHLLLEKYKFLERLLEAPKTDNK